MRVLVLLSALSLCPATEAALQLPATRPPWTQSRIVGSPEPPPPFRVEVAFPNLNFTNPVEMMAEPGADRFYLAELGGRIFRFDNQPQARAVEIADLKRQLPKFLRLLGFQFDPGFETNRQVYLCYNTANKQPDGSRISRFELSAANPPRLVPESEEVIITWLSGGHNGCALHFGPEDGFLYFSTGDAEVPSPPDPLNTGQDISDILGSIQRIDVRRPSGGKNYSIPPDNPFVNTPGAHPAVWAYGLRNPWRMSFDDASGRLLVGDVGWELWEMVYAVEKGGNYGWSITEGPQPVKPDQKPGPTPILKPLIAHSHVEAMSITGGYTWLSPRLPGLRGHWIYGDYVTGKLWSFRFEDGRMRDHRELLDSPLRVICFGRDHSGEVFVVDYGGQIYRFEENTGARANQAFPRRLSQTGLFRDIRRQLPAPGVIPYEIEVEPWMDGARARRFLAIPGNGRLDLHQRNNPAYGILRDFFAFPSNTVIARTISLGKRHIETQLLHFDGVDWRPYNYLWNEEQSEAHLADGKGADLELGKDKRPWRIHSNTECMTCHMARSGFVLGLHHQFTDFRPTINGRRQNQLEAWEMMGLLARRPKPAGWRSQESPLQRQARAYLHVNCAPCHRRGGGGAAPFELRADMPLDRIQLFDVKPNQGGFGLKDPAIVVPGAPYRSVLLYRMASTGGAHMPKLGSRTVDPRGLKLVRDWIAELGHGAPPELTDTPPAIYQDTGKSLQYALRLDEMAPSKRPPLPQVESMPAPVYDLFERFIPEAARRRTIGPQADTAAILALKGNAEAGRKLFFQQDRTQCVNCHRLGGQGREVGPDLRGIGSRYDRARILESLLAPSAFIDPRYRAVTIDTRADESFTGFIVSREGGDTVLRDLNGQDHRFKPYQIAATHYGQLSLMPEGLLQSLTPQEAADLVAFLSSLR